MAGGEGHWNVTVGEDWGQTDSGKRLGLVSGVRGGRGGLGAGLWWDSPPFSDVIWRHRWSRNYLPCLTSPWFFKGSHFFFFSFIFISWRLISLQYCSGLCHTLTWISHWFTYTLTAWALIPSPPPHWSLLVLDFKNSRVYISIPNS